jgi:hypothetical protein
MSLWMGALSTWASGTRQVGWGRSDDSRIRRIQQCLQSVTIFLLLKVIDLPPPWMQVRRITADWGLSAIGGLMCSSSPSPWSAGRAMRTSWRRYWE